MAIARLGEAEAAWAEGEEPTRLRACQKAVAELFESLARVGAYGSVVAALDLNEAACEWEAAGEPARAYSALARAGRPLAALEVWQRAGDPNRLAQEAAILAPAVEAQGDLLLAAAVWARGGESLRAAALRAQAFRPYVGAGWVVDTETAERDPHTGSPTRVFAYVLDPANRARNITKEVHCTGGHGTLQALRQLLDEVARLEARVCATDVALSMIGGWALINDGRLPGCDPDGRWRLGAVHVQSRREAWVTDPDPLRVCDKLERAVRRIPLQPLAVRP